MTAICKYYKIQPQTHKQCNSWYGVETDGNTILNQVDNFRQATKLSVGEFHQFYPYYQVRDELDNQYQTYQVYGSYISQYQYQLELTTVDNQEVMRYSTVEAPETLNPLTDNFFYNFNRLIRLQKRTGIPYHQLDWLLHTVEITNGLITAEGGLKVIAHYQYWNQKYEISVNEFVGMLTEINSYRRMGEQETSQMRELFGDSAPALTQALIYGTTEIGKLDSTLHEAMMIGLQVSFIEYSAIIQAITNGGDLTEEFNKAALARFISAVADMYRVVKVFTLLEWDIVTGIKLVEKLGLNVVLFHKEQAINEVLTTLDILVWLSEWLNEETHNLTVEDILTISTLPEEVEDLQASLEAEEYVDGLHEDIQSQRMTASSLINYQTWTYLPDSETVTISSDEWYGHLKNSTPAIIDNYGLVCDVTPDQITTVVETKLTTDIPGDLTPDSETLKEKLIQQIQSYQTEQQQTLTNSLTEETELSEDIIPYLLLWMEQNYYAVLNQFLQWDDDSSEIDKLNPQSLQLYYNIGRHSTVITQLELDAPAVSIIAQQSGWLATGMLTELSLQQVYYISRIRTLLNPSVSSKHWMMYLDRANSTDDNIKFDDVEEQNQILALFLDWPVADISNLTIGEDINIQEGYIKTFQQLDYLYRQIELCRELHFTGEQLSQLNSLNRDTPNWGSSSETHPESSE